MTMIEETAPSPSKAATDRRRTQRRRALQRALLRISVAVLFVGTIYTSGRFGVYMAKRKILGPEPSANVSNLGTVTLGSAGNPVYLGESSEILRDFFLEFTTPGERASADLAERGIRRLNSAVEMTAITENANAVKVKIVSGPISGTVYWVHHSQMPSSPALDPIISPIPES